ncbi:MAG: hypothetical protein WA971_05545 [Microbacterium sp.]
MTTIRNRCLSRLTRVREIAEDERGDVPGWVLVTLMTAGLVVLIWAVAGPALVNLFEQALARVSGIG